MGKKTLTIVDGQEYEEELTLEALSNWSAGRWMAGQQDCSNDVMRRAVALVKASSPNKTCIRDEGTGQLEVVEDVIIDDEAKQLKELEEADAFEKSFKEKNPNAKRAEIEAALSARKK
jgi:hypothetical protein